MNRNLKGIFTIALLFLPVHLFSQGLTLEANGPALVAAGEVFRIEYSIAGLPESFINPENFEGFDIIAGPTSSYREKVYASGGSVHRTLIYGFTYVLIASEPGIYTIPPASATVEGETYRSRSLSIEVADAEATISSRPPPGGAAARQPDQEPRNQQQTQPTTISSDDVLVRLIVDKSNVFKGESVRVSVKLYNRGVPLSGIESAKFPAFNGFWTQELGVDHYGWQRENYNSKIYETKIIKEYLIFPQQSGSLQIEPAELGIVAQIVTRPQRGSLIEELLTGPRVDQVRKKITSSPVTVNVIEFPAGAPASFTGAVGEFTMSAEEPHVTLASNSSANYTLKITGTGNLPLIAAPKLEMPSSFEAYNIKTTESLDLNTSGISGYRQYEYPFIPRAEGEYEIEPIEFTFFHPRAGRYVTLTTNPLKLMVTADSTGTGYFSGGLVSGITKEDIKILGQDIRFIKITRPSLVTAGSFFVGSPAYIVTILLLLLVFGAAYYYLSKYLNSRSNTALIKEKRANKVALQRLRAAETSLNKGDTRRFYDEMLKGLWGYVGDKLNIPAANLTKENVREELLKRDVSPEDVRRYTECISECEYAQYSPAGAGRMQDNYSAAVSIISKLESVINR